MSDFNLKLYKTTDDYKANKAKLRYFFEYLELHFYTTEHFDGRFFECLDVEELLNSLDYYIDETLPAKQTAEDYKRIIIKFFEMLHNEYDIKNTVISNKAVLDYFENAAKNKTQRLKRENKECFDDNELEKLREAIDDFINTQNLEEQLFAEIKNNNGKYPLYRRFLSVLPLKLVMKYGVGNTAIANLKIYDLDLENTILKINEFEIPLDREMIKLFEAYLKIRQYVFLINGLNSDYLFVDGNGTTLFDKNGNANNGVLFYIMDKVLNKTAGRTLGYSTAIDLVQKGADIYMLSLLMGTPPETIYNYSKDCDSILGKKAKIQELLSGSEKKIKKKLNDTNKSSFKCPFCGKIKRAIADEWVLVQVDDNETIYLACKDCEGDDGKIKY